MPIILEIFHKVESLSQSNWGSHEIQLITYIFNCFQAYMTVNEEFAKLTLGAVKRLHKKKPDSVPLVWIHDYHLMCSANFIRSACESEGIPVKIAFFSLQSPIRSRSCLTKTVFKRRSSRFEYKVRIGQLNEILISLVKFKWSFSGFTHQKFLFLISLKKNSHTKTDQLWHHLANRLSKPCKNSGKINDVLHMKNLASVHPMEQNRTVNKVLEPSN